MDKLAESVSANIGLEARKSPRTSRTKEEYYELLRLTDEDIKGKNVLDVGAADSTFAQQIAHLAGTSVRLDPKYTSTQPKNIKDAVTGVAQFLPFKDQAFDLVVASYSLFWVDTNLPETIQELLRVTKTGGRIKIHPAFLYAHHQSGISEEIKYIKETLEITRSGETPDEDLAKYVSEAFTLNFAPKPILLVSDHSPKQKLITPKLVNLSSCTLSIYENGNGKDLTRLIKTKQHEVDF